MDALQWEDARELVKAALGKAPSERAEFLLEHCADPELRAAIDRLLKQHDDGTIAVQPRVDVKDGESTERDELGDLVPGSLIGPYVILDQLGRGGMGQVFLANDSRLSRKVALKCLLSRQDAPDDLRWRIMREARAAARISHPNVATIHDVIEHGSRAFIVMEYVDGESLATRLQRGRLAVDKVIAVGLQLASALVAAHARGIVHRDLKPSNIQIALDGSIKVIDFGVAKAVTIPATATAVTADLTAAAAHGFHGTPGYMSPEQVLGRDVGPRSDLFSLGAVLFEMATGRRLFTSTHPVHLIVSMSKPLPRAAEIDRSVPAGLSDVIARALETDPGRRFQSAAEFEMALVELNRSGDAATTRDQTHVPAPAPADGAGPSDVRELRGRLILAHSQAELLRLKYEVEQFLSTRPSDVDGRILNDNIEHALRMGLIAESAAGTTPHGRPESSSRARRLPYAAVGGFVAVVAIAGSLAVVLLRQPSRSQPAVVSNPPATPAVPSAGPASPPLMAKDDVTGALTRHLAEAQAAFASRDYVTVRERVTRVLEIDPGNREALALRLQADAASRGAKPPPQVAVATTPLPAPRAAAASGPPSPAASLEVETPGIPRRPDEAFPVYTARVQGIRVNLETARNYLAKQDFANALARLRLVEGAQKGYQNVEALIADTVSKQRVAFDAAMDGGQKNETAGKLRDARRWYQSALVIDPNATSARDKDVALLNRMTPDATRLLNRASSAAKTDDVGLATRLYNQILEMLLPGDEIRERAARELESLKR